MILATGCRNLSTNLGGKAAIAYNILKMERESRNLFFEKEHRTDTKTINFGAIQKMWLSLFRKFVTGDRHKDEIVDRFQKSTLIIFNYDRCIEHYLLHSLMMYHKLDDIEAAEILTSLEIIHPYGTVGSLPWQQKGPSIDFGSRPTGDTLTLAEIQTFTEHSEDAELQQLIHNSVGESELILFLGFAYHKQNLDLLTPETSDRNNRVIGTAYKISDSDTALISRSLEKRFCGSRKNAAALNNKYQCKTVAAMLAGAHRDLHKSPAG